MAAGSRICEGNGLETCKASFTMATGEGGRREWMVTRERWGSGH